MVKILPVNRITQKPFESERKVVVHWSIEGFDKGHGEPIPLKQALSWIKKMNKKYGEGTHWYEQTT